MSTETKLLFLVVSAFVSVCIFVLLSSLASAGMSECINIHTQETCLHILGD